MSEIEKMMQNVNVKKHWNSTPYGGIEEYYPPFTAEKQIELIKFLLKNYEGVNIDKSFEESLAGAINEVWADMPEEYQQQVKGILE